MSEVAARETLREQALAMKAVVALLHVANVQRSIEFYQKLGFELGNEPLRNEQGAKIFAWLDGGQRVQIMVTLTGQPLCPGRSGRDVLPVRRRP